MDWDLLTCGVRRHHQALLGQTDILTSYLPCYAKYRLQIRYVSSETPVRRSLMSSDMLGLAILVNSSTRCTALA